MQYQNVSNRTIRVVNVIMKPNNIASFPENLSHVKTFLKMGWLACVGEDPKEESRPARKTQVPAPKPPVVEAPAVVVETPVVEVPAVESPVADAPVIEEAPALEVAPEDGHKRGRGRKGK
jgi:hypothetical protein